MDVDGSTARYDFSHYGGRIYLSETDFKEFVKPYDVGWSDNSVSIIQERAGFQVTYKEWDIHHFEILDKNGNLYRMSTHQTFS